MCVLTYSWLHMCISIHEFFLLNRDESDLQKKKKKRGNQAWVHFSGLGRTKANFGANVDLPHMFDTAREMQKNP